MIKSECTRDVDLDLYMSCPFRSVKIAHHDADQRQGRQEGGMLAEARREDGDGLQATSEEKHMASEPVPRRAGR